MNTFGCPAPMLIGRFVAGAAALSFLLPLEAVAKDYTGLNIFGDSLVDAGNLFNLTGLPPSPPYDQKLSNGPIWVEALASELQLSPTLFTAISPGIFDGTIAAPVDGINFAFGGALSSDVNVGGPPLPGLQQQIEAFGAVSAIAPPDADTLHILLAGGNDYNEAIFKSSPVPFELLPDQITDNLVNAAAAMIGAGAQELLIANLPDVGAAPFADFLDQINPQSSSLLTDFSQQHNQLLAQKLAALEAASGAHITQLDLESLFSAVTNNPAEFGFSNIDDACLTNFQPGFVFEGICDNPDEFLFWDNVHPTTATHSLIAQLALDTLADKKLKGDEPTSGGAQEVPEPANALGLMLVGGGAIALSRTRRTAKTVR
ncbi:MAG: SGNH/GDSL hydrolase family protein [Phormidesmis sp.]